MNTAVETFLEILELEDVEHNLYRGRNPASGWQRVFGGRVVAQALGAVMKTVSVGHHIHSMHGYFMRPGDPSVPILYEVDRIRDGRSFATRRVVAIQHGEAIFSMGASFHIPENGLDHQMEMPDVPQPEDLPSEEELKEKFLKHAPESVQRYWERKRPLELRPTDMRHYVSNEKLPPEQYVWIRATGTLPDDPNIHCCVLAYASDMTLLDTSLFAHGLSVFSDQIQPASIDHSVWFHRSFRADDWLLYATDSPSSSGARGFSRGRIYSRDGRLVASTAQEGLIRQKNQWF